MLLNLDHFYDELINLLDKMVRFSFLRAADRQLILVVESPEGLVDLLTKMFDKLTG